MVIFYFCSALGMEVISKNSGSENLISHLALLFPCKVVEQNSCMKYLGYMLKPSSYSFEDLLWLVRKVEKELGTDL